MIHSCVQSPTEAVVTGQAFEASMIRLTKRFILLKSYIRLQVIAVLAIRRMCLQVLIVYAADDGVVSLRAGAFTPPLLALLPQLEYVIVLGGCLSLLGEVFFHVVGDDGLSVLLENLSLHLL